MSYNFTCTMIVRIKKSDDNYWLGLEKSESSYTDLEK
jgi:hypothetical protein